MTVRTATFPPQASSPRQARQLVRTELDDDRATADGELAMLLTSELATNAVRHAGTDFTVTASVEEGVLAVSVADGSRNPAVASTGMPGTEVRSGRGLVLVATYAT